MIENNINKNYNNSNNNYTEIPWDSADIPKSYPNFDVIVFNDFSNLGFTKQQFNKAIDELTGINNYLKDLKLSDFADVDGDNSISKNEYDSFINLVDADENGKISHNEFTKFISYVDKDNDKKISNDEYKKAFEEADTNGDGSISKEEGKKFRDKKEKEGDKKFKNIVVDLRKNNILSDDCKIEMESEEGEMTIKLTIVFDIQQFDTETVEFKSDDQEDKNNAPQSGNNTPKGGNGPVLE